MADGANGVLASKARAASDNVPLLLQSSAPAQLVRLHPRLTMSLSSHLFRPNNKSQLYWLLRAIAASQAAGKHAAMPARQMRKLPNCSGAQLPAASQWHV